jgi:hypothetical protein
LLKIVIFINILIRKENKFEKYLEAGHTGGDFSVWNAKYPWKKNDFREGDGSKVSRFVATKKRNG